MQDGKIWKMLGVKGKMSNFFLKYQYITPNWFCSPLFISPGGTTYWFKEIEIIWHRNFYIFHFLFAIF